VTDDESGDENDLTNMCEVRWMWQQMLQLEKSMSMSISKHQN